MEGKKEITAKNSAFTSPEAGIYGSLSEPSCKVLGRASVGVEVKRPDAANLAHKLKPATFDELLNILDAGNHRCFHQEPPADPCYMSSSIYYGGPDIIPQRQSFQGTGFSFTRMNCEEEDDFEAATRGNWWLGSLYY